MISVTVKAEPSYGICLLQYDLYGISRPTQNGNGFSKVGAPDTVRLPTVVGKPDTITLTQPMQEWMHRLCWERTPSMKEVDAKMSWRGLTSGGTPGDGSTARAFSDYAGSETHADYINGANLDQGAIKLKHIICGGSFVKILDDDNRKTIKSTDCFVVEAIDPLSDFKKYHPSTHPWLFFYPTISRRMPLKDARGRYSGKFIESLSIPFPQYNDKSIMPIWSSPGEGVVYVPKDRLKLAHRPESPYRHVNTQDEFGNTYRTYVYPNPYI